VGSFVAKIDRRTNCWNANNDLRARYRQYVRGVILKALEDYFDSVPGNDHCTLSLYMIGRSSETAEPTILLISNDPQSRKAAKKVIQESGILRQYSEFRMRCMNKDPGSGSIIPLAFENPADTSTSTTERGVEVLYDSSRPISCAGFPIYVRRSSSLRPATANTLRVGSRIYLQTVGHAFYDSQPPLGTVDTAMEEDMIIDSDSESDTDYNDEMHIGITSAASRSLDTLPYVASSRSGCSGSLSTISRCSTPRRSTITEDYLGDCGPSITALTSALDEVTTNLTSSNPAPQTFALKSPNQPSEASLKSLGKLVKTSDENDWALIEITNTAIEEVLLANSKDPDMPVLAYNEIASGPREDAEVYTYTASSGKMRGILSDTCSYTRLQNGKRFREIYIARMEGKLANGDCGSVVIDAKTGETYGHLVAGCQSTGTAYVLAAHQTTADMEIFRKMLTKIPDTTTYPSYALHYPPSITTPQEAGHSSKARRSGLTVDQVQDT
jgi:hypothetical protein